MEILENRKKSFKRVWKFKEGKKALLGPNALSTFGFYHDSCLRCSFCNQDVIGWNGHPLLSHSCSSSRVWLTSLSNSGCNWATKSNEYPAIDLYREFCVDVVEMANAGFIPFPTLDAPDNVICPFCRIELDGWEPSDDPRFEHQKRSPDCIFFKLKFEKPEVQDVSDLQASVSVESDQQVKVSVESDQDDQQARIQVEKEPRKQAKPETKEQESKNKEINETVEPVEIDESEKENLKPKTRKKRAAPKRKKPAKKPNKPQDSIVDENTTDPIYAKWTEFQQKLSNLNTEIIQNNPDATVKDCLILLMNQSLAKFEEYMDQRIASLYPIS